MTIEKKRAYIINVIFIAMLLGLSFIVIKYFLGMITPFIIGFIVAAVLQKPISWISKKTHIGRGIVSVILVFVLVGVLGVGLYFLLYNIISEIISLVSKFPGFFTESWPIIYSKINQNMSYILKSLPTGMSNSLSDWINNINLESEIYTALMNIASTAGKSAANFATSIPVIIVTFIITVVSCCFLSIDYPNVIAFFKRQIPNHHGLAVSNLKGIFVDSIFKMIKAYALLMFVTFAQLAVFLTVSGYICGDDTLKKYSVAIAFAIAIVDILPVLGTGSIMIPWAIISILMSNWPMAICLLVSYAIITVIRQVLEPRVIGGQIGLNPIVTLFFMYLGLQVIGVMGMFIFPMTVICLKKLQDNGHIKMWK